MSRYRRIPTEIDAIQWDGTSEAAIRIAALGANFGVPFRIDRPGILRSGKGGAQGFVPLPLGHWVAKAGDDHFYPIDPDVFAVTYQPVNA